MTRIKVGEIYFYQQILDAAINDNLVIFAGAGVSMGAPSNLPSFSDLAAKIAEGSGQEPSKPLDRFLGRLEHSGVKVQQRAGSILSPGKRKPNDLHRDLVSVFRSVESVRIVTTNFDLNFECAADSIFDSLPEVYQAPALPLGHDFSGIVYLNGSLTDYSSLILTDSGFGRAYLTEGWARRFLVGLFQHYTVLFVGYSHDDVVMNYLVRALPAEGMRELFVLTETDANWDVLGISSILFNISSGEDAYKELYEGMRCLSERVRRGALDWKFLISEIARLPPSHDPSAAQEINQALRKIYTTKFFTADARDSNWPLWLAENNHLGFLVSKDKLAAREEVLARWLVNHYVCEYPDVVFEVSMVNDLSINPTFWFLICRQMASDNGDSLSPEKLGQWISVLLVNIPETGDLDALLWLAKRCAKSNLIDSVVRIFLSMAEHQLTVSERPFAAIEQENKSNRQIGYSMRCSEYALRTVWDNHLKNELSNIDELLMEGAVNRIEYIHRDLMTWGQGSFGYDSISWHRSAIEIHEQDRFPKNIDVVIDVVRDYLEMTCSKSGGAEIWIGRLVQSKAPILRRLAIHGMSIRTDCSPDDILGWVLANIGLEAEAERHELYKLVAKAYPSASKEARSTLIGSLPRIEFSSTDDRSAEDWALRFQFDWLSWLLLAMPNCKLAKAALKPIIAVHPGWKLSEYPDLRSWSSTYDWVGPNSPWTVSQLLSKSIDEQISDLLKFEGSEFQGPNRAGLTSAVYESCVQNNQWAFSLGEHLYTLSDWSSDLWRPMFRGLIESLLSADGWSKLLVFVDQPDLLRHLPNEVAGVLYELKSKPFCLELLIKANSIALPTWQEIESDDESDIKDWLSRAINRPAGVIVQFWLGGLSLLMKDSEPAQRSIPEDYKRWFTDVIVNRSVKGGLGRSILASHVAFLYGIDETWTKQNIIPLFNHRDVLVVRQAWDGFLTWGRVNTGLADVLFPALIESVESLYKDDSDKRRTFIDLCTVIAVIHTSAPADDFLIPLYSKGSEGDWITFISRIGGILRHLDVEAKHELWDRFLREYWEKRIDGSYHTLCESEIRKTLNWLPSLGDLYPAGVDLAIKSQLIGIEDTYFLHRLKEDGIANEYPDATAELIIYLAACLSEHRLEYAISCVSDIGSGLPALDPKVKGRVDEALANIGE